MLVISQIYQFWKILWIKLAYKKPYMANIGAVNLRLSELQEKNLEVKELKSKDLSKNWEDLKGVL